MIRQYRPESAGGAPHHPFSVFVEPPAMVIDVLTQLNIPDDLVMVTAVNDETITNLNTPLQDGDQVSFFPPVAGGGWRMSEEFVRLRPFSHQSQV